VPADPTETPADVDRLAANVRACTRSDWPLVDCGEGNDYAANRVRCAFCCAFSSAWITCTCETAAFAGNSGIFSRDTEFSNRVSRALQPALSLHSDRDTASLCGCVSQTYLIQTKKGLLRNEAQFCMDRLQSYNRFNCPFLMLCNSATTNAKPTHNVNTADCRH
jgi:hypothetical protein